jgi:hypothetical protein
VAGAIASGGWIVASFASIAIGFWPLLGLGIVSTVLLAGVNFWFSRELGTFLKSTRVVQDVQIKEKVKVNGKVKEVIRDFPFSQRVNPTRLPAMVKHLTAEVNAYFAHKLGNKHRPIPVPRLLTFTKDELDITFEGRNPGKTALFFPTGLFDYRKNNMTQRHVAALIEQKLVMIYMQRGLFRTITAIGGALLTTLQNLNNSDNIALRLLGIITLPIQLILLVENAIYRMWEIEAWGFVRKMGRGYDGINAIDNTVNPFYETLPTNAEFKKDLEQKKRKAANGSALPGASGWVAVNEYADDDKTGSMFWSFFDILVREIGFLFKEMFNSKPRATNVKNFLRPQITNNDKTISMNTALTPQVPAIASYQRIKNAKYYAKIPAAMRYDVIGPQGSGWVKPTLKDLRDGGGPVDPAPAPAAKRRVSLYGMRTRGRG